MGRDIIVPLDQLDVVETALPADQIPIGVPNGQKAAEIAEESVAAQ